MSWFGVTRTDFTWDSASTTERRHGPAWLTSGVRASRPRFQSARILPMSAASPLPRKQRSSMPQSWVRSCSYKITCRPGVRELRALGTRWNVTKKTSDGATRPAPHAVSYSNHI
jgi:hypothetical protein